MRARLIPSVCLAVVALSAVGAPARSQTSLPELEAIELTEPLHATLALLQEQWIEWLTAYHQRDAAAAAGVLGEIKQTMADLGVERLSDLSLGALVGAVQAARASDFERAEWALEAAELLDPRRPEISFAAATVANLEGNRLRGLMHLATGYLRTIWFPWERTIVLHDLALWILFILFLSVALFVGLLGGARGPALVQDLSEALEARLPSSAARAVAVAVLFVPLALPTGLLWLLIFWSVALWGYASRSERAVLLFAWLLLGIGPELVTEQRRHISVWMSPPTRVVENLAIRRVEGSLLTDLGELRVALPDSPAVKHLLADVHQQLGQWEFARALYLDVVDEEPDNAAAMVNLGAFYYRVADFASAIQLFQRASSSEDLAGQAFFNLSQAYSASYMFGHSEQILRQARQANDEGVSAWLRRSDVEPVVTVRGGLSRRSEIYGALEGSASAPGEASSIWVRLARSWSLRVAVLAAVLALVSSRWLSSRGFYRYRQEGERSKSDEREPLRTVLIPGLERAERGQGVGAFFELLLPVALLTLPLAGSLCYSIPWGFEPGKALMWTVAVVGLVAYVSRRVLRGLTA
ncbi:MAG: hypothetical protein R3244_03220 [Thermoanaerobaculia bacterium]|nr:hypothetical protein [Thermoanaerobaculia bacterium]